jgi:hypothetical protein
LSRARLSVQNVTSQIRNAELVCPFEHRVRLFEN